MYLLNLPNRRVLIIQNVLRVNDKETERPRQDVVQIERKIERFLKEFMQNQEHVASVNYSVSDLEVKFENELNIQIGAHKATINEFDEPI